MNNHADPSTIQRLWGERLDLGTGEMRLITILPRRSGNKETCPLECKIERVKIHAGTLSPGYTMVLPKAPSIDFDKYVLRPPRELWPVPVMEDRGPKQNVFRRFIQKARERSRVPVYAGVELDVDDYAVLASNQDPMSGISFKRPIDSKDNLISHNKQMELWSPAYGKAQSEKIPSRWTWGNYVALSYVWGTDNPECPILLNGETYYIRDNLDAALRQFREFRYFKDGLKIWIDALCINQQDEKEKKEQVERMATIYGQAGNVIAWLGKETRLVDYALEIIENTSTLYRTEYIGALDGQVRFQAHAHRNMVMLKLRASRLKFAEAMGQKSDFSDYNRGLIAVYNFFNRPYWRRLWIIQELAMSFSGMPIVCGSRVTQWRYIRDFTLLWHSIASIVRVATIEAFKEAGQVMEDQMTLPHIAAIAQIERINHQTYLEPLDDFTRNMLPAVASGATSGVDNATSGITLQQILKLVVDSNATDARDKVFGMRALPGISSLRIDVDYDKSTTTVYKEFARACIPLDSGLDILSFLDGRENVIDGEELPSWVPNFAMYPDRRLELFDGRFYAGQPFYLGANSSMMVSKRVWARDPNVLTFRGFVADEIDGLGSLAANDLASALSQDPQFEPSIIQPSGTDDLAKQIEISHVDVYYTLVGGANIDGGPVPKDFSGLLSLEEPLSISPENFQFLQASASLRLTASQDFGSYFTPPIRPSHGEPDTRAYSKSSAASTVMQARTRNRRLIVTRGGYLGLAPASSQKGDRIVIIDGWKRPVLIRRIPIAGAPPESSVYPDSGFDGAGPGGYDRTGRWDGKTFYRMIGEVYVAEMMIGEMVRGGPSGARIKFRGGVDEWTEYWLNDGERTAEWKYGVTFYVK